MSRVEPIFTIFKKQEYLKTELSEVKVLNPHSGGEAAQFNMIVSGISLRSTPYTIFNVRSAKINPQSEIVSGLDPSHYQFEVKYDS